MMNNYYDNFQPLRPYTHSLPANPNTRQPANALRGDTPTTDVTGFWPCKCPESLEYATAQGWDTESAIEGYGPRNMNPDWLMVEDHRGKQGWVNGEPFTVTQVGPLPPGWSDTAPEPKYTLAEAKEKKYAEIIAGANAVKSALSSRFSALEENTWPEQEAGARSILGNAGDVKDMTARLILADATATAAAVSLVEQLAAVDKVAPEEFASRIVSNAEAAHGAGVMSLLEQRGMERSVNAARTVKTVLAVEVKYSVLEQLSGQG